MDYLDSHAGAFSAILTAVLVLVTTYYAWQNQRMVREMRRTRELAILPKLALEFQPLAPMVLTVAIKNVGPGAALDVDVRLTYVPTNAEQAIVERRWTASTMVSGEQHDFFPPGELGGNLATLPATYRTIGLDGSVHDASGKRYEVQDSLDSLPAWSEVLEKAERRWVAAPETRLGDEIGKKLSRPLGEVSAALKLIAAAVRSQR